MSAPHPVITMQQRPLCPGISHAEEGLLLLAFASRSSSGLAAKESFIGSAVELCSCVAVSGNSV